MTETPPSDTVHATCVAIDGHGVLIIGPSGSGKSDLALRLIDRGAVLVSDDRTIVDVIDHRLVAKAPDRLAGKLEVRGLGIVSQSCLEYAVLALAVVIVADPPRMPVSNDAVAISDIPLPRIRLDAKESSAPLKVEIALRSLPE